MPTPIDPAQAASIYANNANVSGMNPSAKNDEASFSDLLENTVRNQIDIMKEGEKTAAKAVTGEADITDVVMSANAAEITLQTVVAVRDKLTQAYQEIMRMPM